MRTRYPIFDHRGGVNSNYSEETLQRNEVRSCINGRLTAFGAVVKRTGTQRVHDAVISSSTADVLGGIQWDAPSASAQIVCIAGSELYYKALSATDFTEVLGTFSTTARPSFASFIVGGSRRLYIADGTLRYWDGTSISAAGGTPPSATVIKVYKSRIFAMDGSKTIYWCKVADPTDWTSGGGGGSAPVETYDDEPLVGMETVGSSLLLFKEDSIARYTGVTRDTIEIDQDTEGVSSDVGCVARGTIVRFNQLVFFLSDRGPYLATESDVQFIGDRIADGLDDVSKANWQNSVAVHDKANKEIHLWMPSSSTGNDIGYSFNYELNAWTGPHNIAGSSYTIYSAWGVENSDATENVYYGGGDGRVRDADLATAYDDRTRSDTGGTVVTMDVEYPAIFAGDAGTVKMLHPTQIVHADLKTDGSLQVITSSDLSASSTVTVASAGTGMRPYKVRPACRGRRPKITLRDATAERVQINGLDLELELGRRVA